MSLYQICVGAFRQVLDRYLGQALNASVVEKIKVQLQHQVEVVSAIVNKQIGCEEIVWLPDETSEEMIPCLRPVEVIHEGGECFTFSCQALSDKRILELFSIEELLTSQSDFLRRIGRDLFSREKIKVDFVVSKDGVEFGEGE